MFTKVLIANRGAIATRIIRTLQRLNIQAVVVHSEADANTLPVQQADEAWSLGDGNAAETYLHQQKILDIAKQANVQAIHPGYGFLSENQDFALQCEQLDIVFLGPTAEQMTAFSLKHAARELAIKHQIPLLPGTELLDSCEHALIEANQIGYPVMLKSTAGGGGIGMQLCWSASELEQTYQSVKRLSENNFANGGLFLEKFVAHARHIEVQIFGDGLGHVVAFGERDCSCQRRNQKVIEETPAPNLSEDLRIELQNLAIRLTSAVNYRSAGTVEFVYDQDSKQCYFLEVNTRLQVEHGVTEQVYNIDIVEWMLRLGAGELGDIQQQVKSLPPQGHSIQVRLYAEDPHKDFQPCAGLLSHVNFPAIDGKQLRIDHWLESGLEVSAYYDPMLAKVIVHKATRQQALAYLQQILTKIELYGIETNQAYLQAILATEIFIEGKIFTRYLNDFSFQPQTMDVLVAGVQTTIQDYPGRVGYWDVGVPPSGPMDHWSFRLGNQLLGNDPTMAGLEITLTGPRFRFNCATAIVLTGANMQATLDDVPISFYQVINIKPKQILNITKLTAAGSRCYLLVAGGIQCPTYLNSRATFSLGQFGGHAGRLLRVGDVLHLAPSATKPALSLPPALQPTLQHQWQIRVIYGPHGAPDFFTEADITTFFASDWEVHYNSSRTGIRLIGPKPQWARSDGGEAGMHPSNIHDNAYAIGTIDFTGDMPVILGPDGPSLGGFVCPATIIKADLWKMGQLKAGDKIRFVPVSMVHAIELEQRQLQALATLQPYQDNIPPCKITTPILKTLPATDYGVDIVYRASAENYLLIEYGPLVLDINLRFRVHAIMLQLQQDKIPGILELTPGIRSLQIHYDNLLLSLTPLLTKLEIIEANLGNIEDLEIPTRTIWLPLSWDDVACQQAIDKYMQSVRQDAPWCPSNIEFIRRINGLDSIEQVKQIVFAATYLVMGLGDVYLGAPVATPLDPRHRLVTTKYNPARTWTAENSVGIGGSYLCVYGMEGPGGYQFIGRTLQMWNRYRQTRVFSQPWLLRFFDQIRFYPVSAEELQQIRLDFPLGKYPLKIEPSTFSLKQYNQFLTDHVDSIQAFTQQRESAFNQELQRWIASGQINFQAHQTLTEEQIDEAPLPDNSIPVESHITGNIWKIEVSLEQVVQAGDVLMILESMKMEIQVLAPEAGKILTISHPEGAHVLAGQRLLILETNI